MTIFAKLGDLVNLKSPRQVLSKFKAHTGQTLREFRSSLSRKNP